MPRTWGERAHQAPGCLSCSGWEGTKRRRKQVRAFLEHPKTGTTRHARQAPYRAAGSLSNVAGESTHTCEGGQTQCGRNTVSAPHTGRYLSAAPLPPLSKTELVNLNKRPPLPTCVRGEIRHGRDRQTEAK